MRAFLGVFVEVGALAGVLALALAVPPGVPFALYVVAAQLLSTYLVHCPTHYLVGRVVGVRFRAMRLGRTTLAKSLPKRAARFAKLLPILTLSTDRASLTGGSRRGLALMYASGTVASTSIAFVVAAAAATRQSLGYAWVSWVVAVLYLTFDLIFSPRTGDLMRARRTLVR
jgi:hypothetical protein